MRNPLSGILTVLLFVLIASSVSAQVFLRSIPTPISGTSAICWDGTGFWTGAATGANNNLLIRISSVDGAPMDTILSPVNGSDGLAWDGTNLWTISGASSRQRIFKLNPVDGAILDSIPDPAHGQAGGMTWDGQNLWVTMYFPTDSIFKIEPLNGTVLQSLGVFGDEPRGLAYEGGYIWNSSVDTDGDFIYRMNATTGVLNWQFELPQHSSLPDRRLRGLAWMGSHLWIVAFPQNTTVNSVLEYDVSNAIFPDITVVSAAHDFGAHVVSFPDQWILEGTNIGNSVLTIDQTTFSVGQAFHVQVPGGLPLNVQPNFNFTMEIEFDPPAAGTFLDTLWLNSNDPDENPLGIYLAGIGLANEGDIDPNPTSIDFGQIWIPNPLLSSSRTIEVHNRGSGVLTLSSVNTSGSPSFRVENLTLPAQIDSQALLSLRVWFEPIIEGMSNGTLVIESDDPDEPTRQIPLAGSAGYASFEAGNSIWVYQDFTDDFDVGINAVEWISDVNSDGIYDVVASSGSGLTFCFNGSSTGLADTFWTFNTRLYSNHSGSVPYDRALATISDITGDGVQEVILGTGGGSRSVYALSGATGDSLWMFDTNYWGSGGWVYDVAEIHDLNGDFVDDVVAAGGGSDGTAPRRVFALNGQNGSLLWEGPAIDAHYSCEVVGDVSGDGIDDVVGGSVGWVVGINGTNGASLWQTSIGAGSPVFDMQRMGNANPNVNQTEDLVVASAYTGVYAIDGGTGQQLWLHPTSFVYRVTAGSDITGDGVRDLYVGLVAGHVLCLDGATGATIWDIIADPGGPENILSMATVPDLTGDLIDEIVCGTLGDYLVVLEGWDGTEYFSTQGSGLSDAVDAVGVLPDIDGSRLPEILLANRAGMVECISGGERPDAASTGKPVAASFALYPAYPNPFNPSTTISFSLPERAQVSLVVHDILGRAVTELVSGFRAAGEHHSIWDGAQAGSGTYFVRLETPKYSATQRIVLIK